MELPPLPPLVGNIIDGAATWESIGDIDYSTIGYLLCCHMVLENYVEAFMQAEAGDCFSIKSGRLTFGQKISMLSAATSLPDKYDFLPSLKHLNSLRNRLGHNVRTVISEKELLPLIHFVEKATESKLHKRDTLSVIRHYTEFVCSWLGASYVHIKEGPHIDRRAAFEKWAKGHLSAAHEQSDVNLLGNEN